MNSLIATGLFFLLGPYVGTSANRFWTVRKDCVGGLWGALNDLSCYAAVWFSSKSVADRAARALVTRLGLCSQALLFKQARGDGDDLDDLTHAGLLLEHEAAALAPLPSKAQVVWAWLLRFWSRALRDDFECSPIPHAATVAPLVLERCMHGRSAIGTALTFIDTQQVMHNTNVAHTKLTRELAMLALNICITLLISKLYFVAAIPLRAPSIHDHRCRLAGQCHTRGHSHWPRTSA